MKHQIEFKNFEPAEGVRNLIESLLAHLDRLASGLRGDPLFVRFSAEHVPPRSLFRVSLTMEVPQKTLADKQETHDLEAAIRQAFAGIERQFEAYKSSMRGEHWWKRVARRRELKRKAAGAPSSESAADPQWFFTVVEPHLETLREIAGHVLRFAEARGDLPEHTLELDDVVDGALARAYDDFAKERFPSNIRSRLVRFALDEIKAAVRRAKLERDFFVSLDDKVPVTTAEEQVSTLGDEILDFYQPDEDLKLADLVPNLEAPASDAVADTENIRRCVRSALRDLSPDSRRALVLRYIVGLRDRELATSLRKPEAEVDRLLDSARSHLRRKLIASGCTLKAAHPVS